MMTEELFNCLKVNGLFKEIEWFGVDLNGQIGVFIAGSNAFVPEKIWDSYEVYRRTLNYFISRLKVKSYQEILDSIGNQDFIDFAASGLFSFDYEQKTYGIYNLVETPAKALNVNNLELERHLIEALPKFDIIFGESQINCENLI